MQHVKPVVLEPTLQGSHGDTTRPVNIGTDWLVIDDRRADSKLRRMAKHCARQLSSNQALIATVGQIAINSIDINTLVRYGKTERLHVTANIDFAAFQVVQGQREV